MLKLTWLEFFFRLIPEVFIIIWGIHIICRKKINIKKYIVSCLIFSLLVFGIRYLPIYYGVHTEICILLTIFIMCINGVPLIKVIPNTFLIYVLLSASESLNLLILNVLNININLIDFNPLIKCLYGVPSLIFLVLFIILINYILSRKDGIKNVFN